MLNDDVGRGEPQSDGAAASGGSMPRWVRRFIIAAAVLVAVGVVMMVLVGGKHGPGRHRSLAPVSSHAAVAVEYGAASSSFHA